MAAAPFKVKALFEYTSSHEDDLPFDIGQIITVTDVDDPDWYGGEYVDASGETREGIFPRNFVEKYEPVAPPRPTRTKKKETEAAPVHLPAAPEPEPEQVQEQIKPEAEDVEEEAPVASPPPPATEPRLPEAPAAPASKVADPIAAAAAPTPAPLKAEPAIKAPAKVPAPVRSGPPPVSEKPAGSSFKDRIAAFNKSAAPPIAPFKPGGLGSGSGGFIKKPFVAPPPSRDAYVPPPREKQAAKVYRRDEDPEIRDKEAENTENAAKAGLIPSQSQEGQEEDQPKPMSLKERMALLQKQQAEAAQRHADVASKKEKPKRPPPKKRTDSQEPVERTSTDVVEAPSLERRNTESMDEAQPPPPPPRQPLPTRRKSSKGAPEDGNEADMSGAGDTTEGPEDLTEREDSDAQPKLLSRAPTGASTRQVQAEAAEEKEGYADEAEGEEEDEEEDDEDPEVRRKEELRARMAKMSAGMGGLGGIGMMGMHNPFAAPLPSAGATKKKKPPPIERRPSEQHEEEISSPRVAPPIPTPMALPGMSRDQPKEDDESEGPESAAEDDATPITAASPRATAPEPPLRSPVAVPPVPGSRPAPPPVPAESRPPPPPPPPAAGVTSPSIGSESDDELSESQTQTLETPRGDAPPASRAPPPPIPVASPTMAPISPRSTKRNSYIGEELSPVSPPQPSKRNSRPPPIPGAAPPAPSQSRPPPPPPPGGAPGRTSISEERVVSPMKPGPLDNGEEEEITDYDGDYDTDIASSVPHKEALKSHARDSSLDDTTSVKSPASDVPPPLLPPPIPASAPRAVPPPIPSQPPPPARPSADMPRAAPPPPPPSKIESHAQDDDEYDPYNYSAPRPGVSKTLSYNMSRAEDEIRSPQSTKPPQLASSYQSPPAPTVRAPPPAPPQGPPHRAQRQSVDIQRAAARRSMDVNRPSVSVESGFVADDVDLAQHTSWWLQPNGVPPVFQGRRDIFFESDESTTSAPGGRTVVTKEVYVLFQDYSQTIITARFDPQNPSDTELDQRHEPPPRALRQDQLEQAYEQYGLQIANTVPTKKDSVVGDGSPQALVYELLKPFKDVLLPVGTRAYGALVYANMANASTQMTDEIRPGDIISIRNAKFQGKHGPMHAKYSMEVGKPDHVAVVAEWDGTKKKVRAWEQGRENKKVKQESFKLDDLRSGEVKIWRVMPRSWVGWDSQH